MVQAISTYSRLRRLKYLLDTHVIIWLVGSQKRIPKLIQEAASSECAISALSLYEIYFKASGRALETAASITEYLKASHSPILTITEQDAIAAAKLPLIHGDPIDRLLIAQAKNRSLTLVTADSYIPRYNVKTLEI